MKNVVFSLALLLFPFRIVHSQQDLQTTERYENCQLNRQVDSEEIFQDYKISFGQADEQMCHYIEIKKGNEVVFYEEDIGSHYYLGTDFLARRDAFLQLSAGYVDLVVSKWSGGAHCCYSMHIFRLGDEFKEINYIESGNSQSEFVDLDQDGVPEIRLADDFLAYVFSSFAFSATGEVVLKYNGESYVVSSDHMVKSPIALSREEFLRIQAEFKENQGTDDLPHSFVQAVTDLVYSGNKDQALQLIDQVWPGHIPGKQKFVAEYEEALADSKFYPSFEASLR